MIVKERQRTAGGNAGADSEARRRSEVTNNETAARPVLMPCPFCGGMNIGTEGYHHGLRQHYLACRECDCEGPYTESHREAVAAWNRRVAPAGAGDALLRCVDDEPELPGDIPEEMLDAVQNRVTAAETLRIVVRLTKRGIRERLAAALKETGRE